MKTIIAGSRAGITYDDLLDGIKECPWEITCVVSGRAIGVDTFGEEYAKFMNISIEYYPADWKKYGKAAGHIRNQVMAENAEALLAVWDGKSKGTLDMINRAKKMSLKVHVYIPGSLQY